MIVCFFFRFLYKYNYMYIYIYIYSQHTNHLKQAHTSFQLSIFEPQEKTTTTAEPFFSRKNRMRFSWSLESHEAKSFKQKSGSDYLTTNPAFGSLTFARKGGKLFSLWSSKPKRSSFLWFSALMMNRLMLFGK